MEKPEFFLGITLCEKNLSYEIFQPLSFNKNCRPFFCVFGNLIKFIRINKTYHSLIYTLKYCISFSVFI